MYRDSAKADLIKADRLSMGRETSLLITAALAVALCQPGVSISSFISSFSVYHEVICSCSSLARFYLVCEGAGRRVSCALQS